MANKRILLGLTTITPGEWRNKVKEIDELGLKEMALFPTCLDLPRRQELYNLLEKTGLAEIPHVHIREEDTQGWEFDYLIKRYKTQVFNLHASEEAAASIKRNRKHKNLIYVENRFMDDNLAEIAASSGGVCLDLSHWENYGFLKKYPGYAELPELLKKYKIGCNHISAIKPIKVPCHDQLSGRDYFDYADHNLTDLSELDYVKKYKNYLADIISIELENPLRRQLEVKKYLEEILGLSAN